MIRSFKLLKKKANMSQFLTAINILIIYVTYMIDGDSTSKITTSLKLVPISQGMAKLKIKIPMLRRAFQCKAKPGMKAETEGITMKM